MTKAPEPFDGEPKPTFTLSAPALCALREIAADHPYGVGLADEGEAYVTVLLYDAEGKVVDYRTVFPDGGYGDSQLGWLVSRRPNAAR